MIETDSRLKWNWRGSFVNPGDKAGFLALPGNWKWPPVASHRGAKDPMLTHCESERSFKKAHVVNLFGLISGEALPILTLRISWPQAHLVQLVSSVCVYAVQHLETVLTRLARGPHWLGV